MTILAAERGASASSEVAGAIITVVIAGGIGILAFSVDHGSLTNIPGINDPATLAAQQQAEGLAPAAEARR